MIVTCWSVKGGSGTSVVAGALAVSMAEERAVLALDLAGDLPAVLGAPPADGPGVLDWLHAGSGVGSAALDALAAPLTAGLRLVHRGRGDPEPTARWAALGDALEALPDDVVIDAGRAPLPPALIKITTESVLVIRPCYLALRRASAIDDAPTVVVVVDEPGRALGRRDIEHVVGIRVVAEMGLDPSVSRAVDAGLLSSRLPATLRQLAKSIARSFERSAALAPQAVGR